MVSGRFSKKENLHVRLVLDRHKMTKFLHPPATIINIYIAVLTGFSHIYHPDGLSDTSLFQDRALKNGFHSGNGGQTVHFKERQIVNLISYWIFIFVMIYLAHKFIIVNTLFPFLSCTYAHTNRGCLFLCLDFIYCLWCKNKSPDKEDAEDK